ncbi:MAG: hypothetical protein M3O30_17470 [Planctomycetota bacterium]|nr:hypothetical protein [Planctomycetota bacterium]
MLDIGDQLAIAEQLALLRAAGFARLMDVLVSDDSIYFGSDPRTSRRISFCRLGKKLGIKSSAARALVTKARQLLQGEIPWQQHSTPDNSQRSFPPGETATDAASPPLCTG